MPAVALILDTCWLSFDPVSNPLEAESYDFHLERKVGSWEAVEEHKTDSCQFLSGDSAFQESCCAPDSLTIILVWGWAGLPAVRELTQLMWMCCWKFVAVIPSGFCTGNLKYIDCIPDLKAWLQSCCECFRVEFFTEFLSLWFSRVCSLNLVDSIYQNPQSRRRNIVQSFNLLFGVSWHTCEDLGRSWEDDRTLKEHTYVKSKFLHWP